jgi:hypothetical protein
MQVPFGFWFFGTDPSGAIEFARTLFLTTFTLPSNGKEFTVPVELSIRVLESSIMAKCLALVEGKEEKSRLTTSTVSIFPGTSFPRLSLGRLC